jgi:hypothetical protein
MSCHELPKGNPSSNRMLLMMLPVTLPVSPIPEFPACHTIS